MGQRWRPFLVCGRFVLLGFCRNPCFTKYLPIKASAVGANAETNISARSIPQEPMVGCPIFACSRSLESRFWIVSQYLLANLAISPSFGRASCLANYPGSTTYLDIFNHQKSANSWPSPQWCISTTSECIRYTKQRCSFQLYSAMWIDTTVLGPDRQKYWMQPERFPNWRLYKLVGSFRLFHRGRLLCSF